MSWLRSIFAAALALALLTSPIVALSQWGNLISTPASGGPPAVTYVGSTVVADSGSGAGTIAWPSGTIAGDSAVIILFAYQPPSQSLTGTGFSTDVATSVYNLTSDGGQWSAYSKLSLTSGDIASPPTYVGTIYGGYIVYVVSGAAGYNFIGQTSAESGTTISVTGFTKNANSSLISSLVIFRTFGGTGATQPSGFTKEVLTALTYYEGGAGDVASGSYTNGAAVAWTGINSGNQGSAALYEWLR